MLYHLLRPLIGLTFLILYRRFYFIGKERIPKEGPLLFASNHPTAFLDPIVFPPFSMQVTHFILRGDFFTSRFIRMILKSCKMMPVFRERDGFANMKRNQDLFEVFYDLLNQGKNITVMVEGSHDHHKRLRPVQRGTARIAVGAYKKYGVESTKIVPIGVSFSDFLSFRSFVIVRFGEPIALKDYLELYEQHERKATVQLTKDIERNLKPCVVHIEREEDDEIAELVLEMNRNSQSFPVFSYSERDELFEQQQALLRPINADEDGFVARLSGHIEPYMNLLGQHKLEDAGVGKARKANIGNFLLLLLGFPFFAVGALLGSPIYALVKRMMGKTKKAEFVASVGFAYALLGYAFYFLLGVLIASIVGHLYVWIVVLSMPILGLFSIYYHDFYRTWKAARRFKGLPKLVQTELLAMRMQVLDLFK